MFLRIGQKALEFTTRSHRSGIVGPSNTMHTCSEIISDTIQLTSHRIKNLKLYNSSGIRNHLFSFTKNGKINVTQRIYGSEDLQFLEHIKCRQYIQPKMY